MSLIDDLIAETRKDIKREEDKLAEARFMLANLDYRMAELQRLKDSDELIRQTRKIGGTP